MKTRRRPTRVVHTRVEYYGYGRRARKKQWSWGLIGAGVLAIILLAKAPLLLLIGGGIWWYWRSHYGRRG